MPPLGSVKLVTSVTGQKMSSQEQAEYLIAKAFRWIAGLIQ